MENPLPGDDSAPGNAPRPFRRAARRWLAHLQSLTAALIILHVMPILTNVIILLLLVTSTSPDANLIAACDRVVQTFLTTDSRVELERSKYLIESIPCGIRRRILAASG